MKTTILKEKLKEGIASTERIAAKSLTLPILNNILLNAQKNFLNLSATDLEVGINWWALAKNEKEGRVAIPSRVLSNFINLLPNKSVSLVLDKLTMGIVCDNYRANIKGFDAEDFPIIPSVSNEEGVAVKSKIFCDSLKKICDIASVSTVRPEISGVYFLFQNDTITMVATDSFRLGEKRMNPSSSTRILKDYSLILPQRAVKEIISVFGESEGELMVYFSPNQVLFEDQLSEVDHPHIQLTSRLIDGEYPNYQEIIPKKYETKIIIQTNDLINQVKTASLFSGKSNEVRIKADVSKRQLSVYSRDAEIGEHQGSLPCKIEGKNCEAAFNSKFLIDGLVSLIGSKEKKSEAILELSGSDKPGVLKATDDNSFLYLIMPIKTT